MSWEMAAHRSGAIAWILTERPTLPMGDHPPRGVYDFIFHAIRVLDRRKEACAGDPVAIRTRLLQEIERQRLALILEMDLERMAKEL